MRKVINIDKDWKFSKEASSVPSTFPSDWESIDLPYTFNGDDGQDGGNDYYRGKGYFAKSLAKIRNLRINVIVRRVIGNNNKQIFVLNIIKLNPRGRISAVVNANFFSVKINSTC